MSRNLSSDALQALYLQETGEAFLILLTINHPDLGTPIKITSDGVPTIITDGVTQAPDLTSNLNHLDFTSAAGTIGFTRGKLGKAALSIIKDTGRGRILDDPVFSGLTNFTCEFWFKFTNFGDTSTPRTIMRKSTTAANRFLFMTLTNNNRLRWWHSDGGAGDFFDISIDMVTDFPLDTFVHIAVVKSGDDFEGFINGVSTITKTITGAITGNSIDWEIVEALDSLFAMDELRLWNIVRAEATIAAEMNNQLVGDESGLIGYWPMNEGTEFIQFPFRISLPSSADNRIPRAHLEIDNVDRTIVQIIRQLTSAPTITMDIVRASDPDVIEASFQDFELRDVRYNALTVEGDLTLESFLREPYPSAQFTPADFPGIF